MQSESADDTTEDNNNAHNDIHAQTPKYKNIMTTSLTAPFEYRQLELMIKKGIIINRLPRANLTQ